MLATTTKEMREDMTSEMHVMCIAAATSNAMVVTAAGAETIVATETTAETTGVKDNVNAAGAPPVNDRGPLSGMCSEVMDTVGMKSGMSSENPVESPSCASRTSMRSSTKLWCAHRCLLQMIFFGWLSFRAPSVILDLFRASRCYRAEACQD